MATAFELSDRYVREACELSPLLASDLGVAERHDDWGPDFGLEGVEAWASLQQSYQRQMARHLAADDRRQRLAAQVFADAMEEESRSYEEEDHLFAVRHLGSPVHRIRIAFDVMPKVSSEDWEDVTLRLERIGSPLSDYRTLLAAGLERGKVAAERQVLSVADQAGRLAGGSSSLYALIPENDAGVDGERLRQAIEEARSRFGELEEWLRRVYLPSATRKDGVGLERYSRAAEKMVGLGIDLVATYEWGWEEFHRLRDEMERVAAIIDPDLGVEAVKDFLETDPSVTVWGSDALVSFVEDILARAVDDLAGSHFDVPDVIRPLTVQVAPAGGPLGVYYMPPSEDFSRPGGVWYAIGDQEVFPTYQHASTAYHEGFPGHHLQIATALHQAEKISRFQRVMTWIPGYGEGWGMYAEVLMGELGYLENPHYRFGMLAKQMYRAARVVVDIGLHLGLSIAETSPMAAGEPWTFDNAVEFMRVYGFRTPQQAHDEVLRYLGWPGQAIAYKLGERELLSIRDEMRRAMGPRFDLRSFHATVLEHGTMRFDLLRDVVRERLVN